MQATLIPMMGYGWYFTAITLPVVPMSLGVIWIMWRGIREHWRTTHGHMPLQVVRGADKDEGQGAGQGADEGEGQGWAWMMLGRAGGRVEWAHRLTPASLLRCWRYRTTRMASSTL